MSVMQFANSAQPVAVINEALAKKYFAGLDPLGQAIKFGRADDASKPWLTIIGVLADVKTTTVFQEMGYVEQPAVYRPLPQSAPSSEDWPEPSAARGPLSRGTIKTWPPRTTQTQP